MQRKLNIRLTLFAFDWLTTDDFIHQKNTPKERENYKLFPLNIRNYFYARTA